MTLTEFLRPLSATGVVTFLVFGQSAFAEPPVATTKGHCSPAIAGNRNTVTINCTMNTSSEKDIIRIINRILSNELDLNAVNSKLDELIEIQSRPTQNIIAPNGFAVGSGTLINPTINNYGPPPASFVISRVLPPETTPNGNVVYSWIYAIQSVGPVKYFACGADKTVVNITIFPEEGGVVSTNEGKNNLGGPFFRVSNAFGNYKVSATTNGNSVIAPAIHCGIQ